MNRWIDRVTIITGATGGIGSAIIKELLKYDMIIIGLDFIEQKLEELMKELDVFNNAGKFYAFCCNIRNEQAIVDAFKLIQKDIGPISILINCAGVADQCLLLDADSKLTNKIFETNVTATVICAREAVKSMFSNNINDGHIINMCSILGHTVQSWAYEGIVYTASKHAVCVISEGLRHELLRRNSGIKVTNLSPGLVETAMTGGIKTYTKLKATDIAETCVTVLKTPPNFSVTQLTVVPTIEEYEPKETGTD